MADRTVKVNLVAQVSNYIAGMEKAAAATRAMATESERLAAQKDSFNKIGGALLAVGAVAAAGVGLAIAKFAEFDAKMSQVKTLSHATAGEMDQLTTAAETMGQAIGFSATEVADAEIELVKAGVSVKDIMGGALKGALELAAAGQIDVAQATEIATIALTQFKLQGKDIPHVADLLAAGADKALGGVSDLGNALKSGGLVASQFGVSIEETVGTLSAFANAGLLGETAGTDLRQMLLKLSAPSQQSSDLMKSLGINIYDASGKFVGLANLAGQLKEKLGGLSEAQRNNAESTIFGSRAIAGANVLYNEGAEGIRKWTTSVNDQGFAALQAAGKMDNLQGDIKKLGAAFDTDLIKTGGTANGVLRSVVQTVTGLVTAFGDLPSGAQGTLLAVGAIVAGISLVGGTALLAVPKIAAFKDALLALGTSMRTVSIAGGAVGLAIAALAEIVAAFGQAQAEITSDSQTLADTLDQETGAITKNTRAFAANKLAKDGTIEAGKKVGLSSKEIVDAYLQQPGAINKVNTTLKELNDTSSKYYKGQQAGKVSAQDMIDANGKLQGLIGKGKVTMSEAKSVVEALAGSQGKSAATAKTADQAYAAETAKVQDLAGELSSLIDTVNKANNVGQDAVTANAAYRKSIQDVDDYIQKAKNHTDGYTLTLDASTATGSANIAMLATMAKTSEDAGAKQYALDGNTAAYKQTLENGRQAVIDRAMQLGATRDQAVDLANKIAAIPTEHEFKMLTDISDAQQRVASFVGLLNSIPGSKLVSVGVQVSGAPQLAPYTVRAEGGITAYADSGFGAGIYAGGTPMYKFAEPETRWEAFISGKPGTESRSRQVWADTGRMLGMSPGAAGGGGERPIYMDGNLFGVLREMANGEARIVLNQANARQNLSFGAGRQKGTS